jgi:6-phosphofructokinase 2
MAEDFYARALRRAKERGVRTVIDTQGPPLRYALDEGVDILKASARELGDYLGCRPADPRGWQAAAATLIAHRKANTVVVTLGEGGALLASASGCWHAAVPRVAASTTVGAGDSFLGGLLVRLLAGATDDEALRYAAASGTAALLAAGTGLCEPAAVDGLCAKVELARLAAI